MEEVGWMDRDNFIKSVSLSYIILGLYYCFDITSMNKQTIASLSVAGFLFVLAEYFQVYSEKFPSDKDVFKMFQFLITGFGTLAIIIMIVFPFVNIRRFSENVYDVIGTVTLLIGLGITIYLIAKKNEIKEEKHQEELRKIIHDHEQFAMEIQEIITAYKEEVKVLNDALPHYEELMNSKD